MTRQLSLSRNTTAPAGRYTGNDVDVTGDKQADTLLFQFDSSSNSLSVHRFENGKAGSAINTFPVREGQTYRIPVDGKWGADSTGRKQGFDGQADESLYFEFNGFHVENIRRDRVRPKA